MKSLDYIKTTEGIIGYSASTIAKGEKNDCVVRAIASCFDMPYDDAHKFVKEQFNRKDRKGTYNTHSILEKMSLTDKVINGKKISKVYFEEKIIENIVQKRGIKGVYLTSEVIKPTVGKFVKQNPQGTFLIIVRGHAFTIKDGKVIGNITDSTKLKTKIINAFKID